MFIFFNYKAERIIVLAFQTDSIFNLISPFVYDDLLETLEVQHVGEHEGSLLDLLYLRIEDIFTYLVLPKNKTFRESAIWLNGRKDTWMNGDTQTHTWLYERTDTWIDGETDGQTLIRTKEQTTDEQNLRQTDEQTKIQ